MLQPLRVNRSRRQTNTTRSIPAPSGGLNSRDDLNDMKPNEAIVMDNLIPAETGCRIRRGKASHATGLGAAVTSLIHYAAPDGTEEMFGATSTDIYDVSGLGAVGAAVVTGLTNGYWQQQQITTAGGSFVLICNGNDAMRTYNGTTWSSTSITGVSSSNIINIASHMRRLWLIEKDSLSVWYLATDSVAGAATEFDLGAVTKLGGHLVAMASWTRDGGEGLDDVAAFITSKGEMHVYAGSDPDSASTWSRVGTFRIPKPIGFRCVVKSGADIGVLTEAGPISAVTATGLSRSAQEKSALTDKISRTIQMAYEVAGTFNGWQVIEYPNDRIIILNVPLEEEYQQVQYAMNVANGNWGKFIGLDANVWQNYGDNLYFGDNTGTVWRYDNYDDNGDPIAYQCVHAFTELGTANTKSVRRIRPLFFGATGAEPSVGCRFDYDEDNQILSTIAPAPSTGALWDTFLWDTTLWGASGTPVNRWYAFGGEGTALAPIVAGETVNYMSYNGCKIVYEIGDGI